MCQGTDPQTNFRGDVEKRHFSLLMKYHIGLVSAERHRKQLEKRAKLERCLILQGRHRKGKDRQRFV